jgi:hypothetical protein
MYLNVLIDVKERWLDEHSMKLVIFQSVFSFFDMLFYGPTTLLPPRQAECIIWGGMQKSP